jgi:hypothetical protein
MAAHAGPDSSAAVTSGFTTSWAESRLAAHLLGCALGDLAAEVDADDGIGHVHHHVHIVLHQQHADALLAHRKDGAIQRCRSMIVQACRRFTAKLRAGAVDGLGQRGAAPARRVMELACTSGKVGSSHQGRGRGKTK